MTGALVLTIEVMGSRVIGPFFGVSLYVWTSLVTVTLLALAVGYAVGGHIADRFPPADALYWMILLAAGCLLVVPYIREPVLRGSVELGLRGGALAASAVLFGPCLFALGCVSPLLVRNAQPPHGRLGRTVGSLYALSTLGSVMGALLTGYVLIGYMGIDTILRLCAAVMASLAVGYFAVVRQRWWMVVVLVVPLLHVETEQPSILRMQDGTQAHQVASMHSLYGALKVVDYRYGETAFREMIIDGLVQGAMDESNGLSVYEYAYLMQYLPMSIHRNGKRCLIIGLGAGIVPRWYESQGIITDVVDIDPAVVDAAREHFGFKPNGEIFIADARRFVTTTSRSYDYVILDVFTGDTTPSHLLSQEALRAISNRLSKGGVVAFNIIGRLTPPSLMMSSIVRTMRTVFEQVDVYPAFDPHHGNSMGNVVIMAYQGAKRYPDRAWLAQLPVHRLAASVYTQDLFRQFNLNVDASSIVITDDFNPLDFHDALLRERVRQQILDSTHWSLLLGALSTQGPIREHA